MERTQQNRRTLPLPHPGPATSVRPPAERSDRLDPREISRVHPRRQSDAAVGRPRAGRYQAGCRTARRWDKTCAPGAGRWCGAVEKTRDGGGGVLERCLGRQRVPAAARGGDGCAVLGAPGETAREWSPPCSTDRDGCHDPLCAE